MTEQEAIKRLRSFEVDGNRFVRISMHGRHKEIEVAISALEEIRKYRKLGTVEEIKSLITESEEEFDMLMEYRKIGTVEELRRVMEKQKPKNPIDDTEFGICPCCHNEFNSELLEEYNVRYCLYCGQKIDWSLESEG